MRRLVIALDALTPARDADAEATTDLAACATLAHLGGADAVQIGVTEDSQARRDPEVRDLRRGPASLELRLTPVPGLLKLALEVRPRRVVFATETGRGRVGGPIDFRAWGSALPAAARMLREAGVQVAALVAPDLDAVKTAHSAAIEAVDLYCGALFDLPPTEQRAALERLSDVARLAEKLRLGIGATGGLGFANLDALLAAVPALARVCVGRAFVARAVLVGVDRAIRDLRARVD